MPENTVTESGQSRRVGRPAKPTELARRNRVVTLVTDAELKQLVSIANHEQRSLSAVVHRILCEHLSQQ